MHTVTALRPERRDRVLVELDGAPWRIVPAAAVVAAGLSVGGPLDRERARELRRALRRVAARDTAARALSRRDRSAAELGAHLEQRGIDGPRARETVEAMQSLGYVDDGRFASSRARVMAGRGYGDEAIRWDLEQRGLGAGAVELALHELEPESRRATALAARLGPGPKAARTLAARGFSAEAIEVVVGVA
jgi:SOS response regulatory protein OraA/RecX